MIGRVLLVASLWVPIGAGCATMRRPPKAALVDPAADSQKTMPRLVEASEDVHPRDGWLAATRRRLAQAATDIKADLDFHETEGLEAFSPDAVEQVKAMRGDMNGSSDIRR